MPADHHPIYLLNGRSGGEAQSQCIPFGFQWPEHQRLPVPPRASGTSPPMVVCARGLTPTEQALGPALATARESSRPSPGRLDVAGAQGRVTLRRPEAPVLNPFGNTPGPGPYVMWGEWQVAALNGKAPDTTMTLLFFRQRLELVSGCVAFGRYVEQIGPDLTLAPDPGVATTCERMMTPDEQAAERILAGTLQLTSSEPRRRTLAGPGGNLTLVR